MGGDGWSNLSNILCKAVRNCHNESPKYVDCILIKMEKDKINKKRTNEEISSGSRKILSDYNVNKHKIVNNQRNVYCVVQKIYCLLYASI
jgi:hypothetical protein